MPEDNYEKTTLPRVARSSNCLLDVSQCRQERVPLSGELKWLSELCGEFVQGGVYLLGGAPGGFKSGLQPF
jgi:hypothetical protein